MNRELQQAQPLLHHSTMSLVGRLYINAQDKLGNLAPERLDHSDFNEARDDGVAVASAGPYANHLHLAADR